MRVNLGYSMEIKVAGSIPQGLKHSQSNTKDHLMPRMKEKGKQSMYAGACGIFQFAALFLTCNLM